MAVYKNKKGIYIIYSLLIIFALLTLIPILLTVLSGFKARAQLRVNLFGLPNPVVWTNFWDVLDPKRSEFFLNLYNSIFVMIFTIGIELVLVCFAGFALARIRFLGREIIFNYFLLGLLFPLAVAILPLYIVLKNLNLLNTHFGVILPQVAFFMPYHIMLARGFFMQIPLELEEASTIDGCGPLRFLVTIIVPLSTPVLTTIAVIAMVTSWNNYFLPLIVLNEAKLFTLPMGVYKFYGQYTIDWALILAFVSLAMIPAITFYILAQKYIVAGLTGGAIKQ
jgi:raffinose/stachyose/melibiose transport system permease protein